MLRNLLSRSVILLFIAGLAVQGCAHGPLQTDQVNIQQTPSQLLVKESRSTENQLDDEPNSKGRLDGTVLWGGVLLSAENLTEGTQLEILSYPLDYLQRPIQTETATGRFVAVYPDYLETVDYSPGRLVTVTGSLDGLATGKVGNSDYSYIKVATEQIHLWSETGEDHTPAFTFGIGISISN